MSSIILYLQSVYQSISLSIKGYIMELHVVAMFEIYCALEPKNWAQPTMQAAGGKTSMVLPQSF